MLWTGRIISALVILFLLFDSSIKILRLAPAVEGTARLGYPVSLVFSIGIVLLVCVVLYAIPRTSILGAILLTGYLGGAVASNLRVSNPFLGYILSPSTSPCSSGEDFTSATTASARSSRCELPRRPNRSMK